ncbi:MFS transporter [uncultured Aurantimicrobium sp.]|uniref:MFS transporter n=1 Tax=uncultured Aurantimicrobium sp. TaxID=1705357 RepID=UPI0026198FC1|nr:MFS transporter [uncultured Aurantimicrobium sp.]
MSQSAAAVTGVPKNAGLVLVALIMGAFVCNINLSVANVALPDIGKAFDASQTQLTLVAVGCTLGLAMSVLYFGAIGDRYGRKLMLLLGMLITVPAAFLCAFAPSVEILSAGRLLTGLAAGMAYPTTLALVTALWAEGAKRTKAIALWSSVSGGSAVLGPFLAGLFLEKLWWGSVFLIVVPVAVVAFLLILKAVPAHVEESTGKVDHLGGVLSVFMIASLVLGIGLISSPDKLTDALALLGLSVVLIALFFWRQRTAANPLYDLTYAKRRLFWVPAVAGMIVLGSLAGAMFVGQQFMQNVMNYSTLESGTAILPAAFGMILVAPQSAKLVVSKGLRFTLLLGYCFILPAFLLMFFTWREGVSYFFIGLAYLLMGIGVGFALTPAARSLTSSVPVFKVGMASGTSDLQRDLGGSVLQAVLGTVLTLGYASAFAKQVTASPDASLVSAQTQSALTQSYSSAATLAARYPDYQSAIISAAQDSFIVGSAVAYASGALFILVGAVLVFFAFPKRHRADELFEEYHKEDAAVATASAK